MYKDIRKDGFWLKGYTWCGVYGKTRAGRLWNNLETRTSGRHKDACYDKAVNGFKDFQEFAEWCSTQPGYLCQDAGGSFWQLDKDLLGDGVTYSPRTCCFLPGKLNTVLVERPNSTGLLAGVTQDRKNSSKFVAKGRELSGKRVHLGSFDTESEAHDAYMAHKRKVVIQAVNEIALPLKVIDGLLTKYLKGGM